MSEWLWRLAARLAPPDAARWIAAMRAEAVCDPHRSPARWLFGALGCAARLRLRAYAAGLAAAALVAIMVSVDWISGALLPATLLVAATAAVLARPSRTAGLRAILIAGGALPLAHAVSHMDRALWPWYQFAPFDGADWAIVVLTFAPAWLGARIGRTLRASKAAPQAV